MTDQFICDLAEANQAPAVRWRENINALLNTQVSLRVYELIMIATGLGVSAAIQWLV